MSDGLKGSETVTRIIVRRTVNLSEKTMRNRCADFELTKSVVGASNKQQTVV